MPDPRVPIICERSGLSVETVSELLRNNWWYEEKTRSWLRNDKNVVAKVQ